MLLWDSVANLDLKACTDLHLVSQCMEKDLVVQASAADPAAQWVAPETSDLMAQWVAPETSDLMAQWVAPVVSIKVAQ